LDVSEAIKNRIATRAFLEKSVPMETLKKIVNIARYAPSGGNLQPWKVHALMGDALEEFIQFIEEFSGGAGRMDGGEFNIYPPDLHDPYRSRRFKCGEDMYKLLGIAREDKHARLSRMSENYRFFGAPVGLFFTIDRRMGKAQWADLGMFVQSFMLVACEYGVATCAQLSWSVWYRQVSDYLQLDENEMLFCGMALGYADKTHPVNQLRTDRAELDEVLAIKTKVNGDI